MIKAMVIIWCMFIICVSALYIIPWTRDIGAFLVGFPLGAVIAFSWLEIRDCLKL